MQWLMLQQEIPEDFVIATGRMETVRKFIEICSKILNWSAHKNGPGIIWEGEGINEIGRRADNNKIIVRIDPKYFRPTEVDKLLGDPQKAFKKLGWSPKTNLEELISEMLKSDLEEAKKEAYLKKKGFKVTESIESQN